MKKYLELLSNYSIVFLLKKSIDEVKRKIWREIILESYSQDYEDLKIEKLLKGCNKRYLEIGGYHPTRLSNTYRLYKKGWTGIIVEPNPDVKEIFNSLRPKDILLNIGISETGDKLKYFKFLIPALNTFSKIDADKSIKMGHNLVGEEMINTNTIEKIVTENFDFVSIDTEGFDAMILKNWPWKKFQPKVICVETDKVEVDKILKKFGYKLKFQNQYNSIYSKK